MEKQSKSIVWLIADMIIKVSLIPIIVQIIDNKIMEKIDEDMKKC